MKTKKHFIFGASGHGKVIAELAANAKCKIDGIFDDNPKRNYFADIPIFHTSDMIKAADNPRLIIAIGDNYIRKSISKRFERFDFYTIIHKKAVVSKSVKIGAGSVVMVNAIINAEAKIGNHVIINSAAIVEHDCVIEDFVHISPGVTLSGNIFVGEGTHIGSGATVIPGIKIGKWCTIGAGTVVIGDVPDGVTLIGNPGRIIKYNVNVDSLEENKRT